MSSRPQNADYAAIALGPVLIFLMISSLANFFVMLFYEGSYPDRVFYLILMYTMGAVSLARLVIEEDRAYSAGYAVGLGAAMLFVMSGFLGNLVFTLGLVLLIGYLADRIVHDCTVIDEGVDASGEGLIDRTLDEASVLADQAQGKPDEDAPLTEKERRRKKSHQPGRTVFLLALAALPLFGLGQFMLGSSPAVWARAQLMLGLYLFSSLSLLVATSFLNLRRYLRQRDVDMPGDVTVAWLVGGISMIAALLVLAFVAPMPGASLAQISLPKFLTDDGKNSSSYGWGSEGAEKADDEQDAGTNSDPNASSKDQVGAGDNQNRPSGEGGGSKSGNGDGSEGKGPKKSGGQQSGGQKSGEQSSGSQSSAGKGEKQGKSESRSSKSDNSKKEAGKNGQKNSDSGDGKQSDQGGGSSQEKKSPGKSSPKGEQSSSDQSSGQNSEGRESSQEADRGEQRESGKSAAEKQSPAGAEGDSADSENGKSDGPEGDQSDGDDPGGEREKPSSDQDSPTNSPEKDSESTDQDTDREEGEGKQESEGDSSDSQPSDSQPSDSQRDRGGEGGAKSGKAESPGSSGSMMPSLSGMLGGLASLIRLLLIIGLVAVVGYYLYRIRDQIARLWQSLFERDVREQNEDGDGSLEELQRQPARPFSSFSNPIGHESDPRRAVVITFQAFDAWARERGMERRSDETPSEFLSRLRSASETQLEVRRQIGPIERPTRQLSTAYDRIVYGRAAARSSDLQAASAIWRHMTSPGSTPTELDQDAVIAN